MLALPFSERSFEIVTTGYGLRYVPDLPAAIGEIRRVLVPGGQLLSLDFNRPSNPSVRAIYLAYLTIVGSALGWALHRDPDTYRYIPASIRQYPGAEGVARLFDRDLRWVTIHASVLMATFILSYHSITFWYPTFLTSMKLPPLRYLVALNAGGLIGSVILGQLSDTRLGRRGAPTLGMLVGLAAAPIYLLSSDPNLLVLGALFIGLGCSGAWGIVPGYLSERFPTDARAVGTGFAYHVGAGLGAFTPYLIGGLRDGGMALPVAMLWCIGVAGVLVLVMLWLGPETRGRELVQGR
jgi:hypothetical protein